MTLAEEIKANPFNHIVSAENVSEFLDRWTRKERRHGDVQVATYQEELDTYGYTFIVHHNSTTGNYVYYFGDTSSDA